MRKFGMLLLVTFLLVTSSALAKDEHHGVRHRVNDLEASIEDLTGQVRALDRAVEELFERIEALESAIPAPLVLHLTPLNGTDAGATQSIVMRFSDSMEPATLQVGGDMALDGWMATWSTSIRPDDTLTLSPATEWTAGAERSLSVRAESVGGQPIADLDLVYSVYAVPADPLVNGDFRECTYVAADAPPVVLPGWEVTTNGSWQLNINQGEMRCFQTVGDREGVVFFGQNQGGLSADENTLSQTITVPADASRLELNGSNTRWGTYPNQYNARLEVYFNGTRIGGPSQGNDFTISADISAYRNQTVVLRIVRPQTSSWSQIWLDWVRIVSGP